MAFRLTPQEPRFFDLFAASPRHLVDGAAELTALLGAAPERARGRPQADARDRARRRARRPTRSSAGSTARSSRRSTARTSTALASRSTTAWTHGGRRRPHRALPRRRAAPGVAEQVEVIGADGRPHGRRHAAAAVDEGPLRVLDRDQPPREPGRQGLPPAAGELFRREPTRITVHEDKDIVDGARGRRGRVRERRATRSRRIAVRES